MNQLTFYKYAAGGLLLLNMVIISFFLFTKPNLPLHGPPPSSFQKEVIDVLHLDAQQTNMFKALAKEHNQKITVLKEQQQTLLLPYFESLANTSIQIEKEDVLNQFQQLEKEKIEVTHQHFQEIKNLLNESQLPHFKDFLDKFIDRLILSDKNNKPPPKDF